jgi:hypothetical protein
MPKALGRSLSQCGGDLRRKELNALDHIAERLAADIDLTNVIRRQPDETA